RPAAARFPPSHSAASDSKAALIHILNSQTPRECSALIRFPPEFLNSLHKTVSPLTNPRSAVIVSTVIRHPERMTGIGCGRTAAPRRRSNMPSTTVANGPGSLPSGMRAAVAKHASIATISRELRSGKFPGFMLNFSLMSQVPGQVRRPKHDVPNGLNGLVGFRNWRGDEGSLTAEFGILPGMSPHIVRNGLSERTGVVGLGGDALCPQYGVVPDYFPRLLESDRTGGGGTRIGRGLLRCSD